MHLSVRACHRYENRLTHAETAIEAALPGISFETYSLVRAAFLAARSQVDEVLRRSRRAIFRWRYPHLRTPSHPRRYRSPSRFACLDRSKGVVTHRSKSALTCALPATQVGPAAEEAAYGSSLVVGLALGVLLLIALVGYLSRA